MTGVDLDAVSERHESPERVEEALRPVTRLDREIRTSRVADEERVSRQDEPGFVATRGVQHGEAAVFRTVARRVDAAQHDFAEQDLVAVLERVVRKLGAGSGVDRDREPVLERESPVPREVVRVRVRLEHTHDANVAARRLLEVLLDRVGGIHDDRLAGSFVADEVGGAPERIVDELREDHSAPDRSSGDRYLS